MGTSQSSFYPINHKTSCYFGSVTLGPRTLSLFDNSNGLSLKIFRRLSTFFSIDGWSCEEGYKDFTFTFKAPAASKYSKIIRRKQSRRTANVHHVGQPTVTSIESGLHLSDCDKASRKHDGLLPHTLIHSTSCKIPL